VLPELPPGLARTLSRSLFAVVVACAVSASLAVPAAADGLTEHRDRVKAQIAQTQNDLDDSSAALSAATAAVQATSAKLSAARAALAKTERELAAAKARDIAMAAKLKQAQLDLDKATAAVTEAQRLLDAQQKRAADIVRNQYQQQTNLLPIAVVVDDSTADLATRLQWSTTLFDTAAAELDRMKELREQLAAKRARQAELEREVAIQRKAAADNLKLKKTLQARAAAQEAAVAGLLVQQQADQRTAAKEVASDKARYASLVRERASVEKRIAIRIAKAKAAAARKAAAERRAREQARKAAAAQRAAEKARKSAGHRSSSSSSGSSSRSSARSSGSSHSSGGGGAHHGFIYPVSAGITSPYGMRFHPVLHIWKLHDGTDFGAGCGTAIHAAYSGRVAERYYNAGYGNRLMIDHGMIDGRYVTTGYNHATRYIVHVGQHVRQGQVIGYVGTTGYSTGCHLHLMVWLNGRVVNPMGWLY
jgi:murein DD-endopeptidase MepM/ murein hydrolase activator NlpD